MSESLQKFQGLLRELFQFDSADLDFGIYRIMNQKREVIERYILQDLPEFIQKEIDRGALAEQSHVHSEFISARQKVLSSLGEKAIDAEGNLIEQYRNTPTGKAYLEAMIKASGAQDHAAIEVAIYNHLYTFFSRYYQDGDFISKRRYSKKERYAIPYNGEEVYLYWANHDQYYVKSGEHFTNYIWKAPNGVSVIFKLRAAEIEQDNVKNDKRFFLLKIEEIDWQEKNAKLIIPMEYRALTDGEAISYGSRNQQDNIIAEILKTVPKKLENESGALSALLSERRMTTDGTPISYLEHHLRNYTSRNTRDFFIHKDLASFLKRELDFYLKNEVLNLEDMESFGDELSESWFQIIMIVKNVGNDIIDFLAQIEEFQKMLWEKRKFITDVRYLITVGDINESFYADIATNEPQWEEWKELFQIDDQETNLFNEGKDKIEKRRVFLKNNSRLVLDTKHFDVEFVDRLLMSFEDLDAETSALLIDSENWHALNLLLKKYREKIRCVYIDPPYNTGNDEFIYKDTYQHSSWLSMIRDRIILSKALLTPDGSHYCQIDTNENFRLGLMIDAILEFQREIIWDTQVLSGYKTIANNWIRGHDTILFHTKEDSYYFNKQKQPHRKEYLDRFDKQDEDGRWYFDGRGTKLYKDEVIEKGKAVGDVWYDIMSFQQQPTSNERVDFSTQKPEELVERIIRASSKESDWVLDYFLGSGTTSATAIMLGRKSIGIEMGEHLSSVAIPRLKRVLYGCPTSVAEKSEYKGGGFVKYLHLESYEDTLNNIEFDESSSQKTMDFENYLLKYMLKWETRDSETLLNVDKMVRPFKYKLHVYSDGQIREITIDIPETFNYLLGMHVQNRQVHDDNGLRYLIYRGVINQRNVVVIWREIEGWDEADFARDKKFIQSSNILKGVDEIYVNGDSLIPESQAVEPVFKSLMFAPIGY